MPPLPCRPCLAPAPRRCPPAAAARFQRRRWRAAAGKRILITGATGGLGGQTATALVRSGATVLVHGSSQERLAATLARLAAAAASDAQTLGYLARTCPTVAGSTRWRRGSAPTIRPSMS